MMSAVWLPAPAWDTLGTCSLPWLRDAAATLLVATEAAAKLSTPEHPRAGAQPRGMMLEPEHSLGGMMLEPGGTAPGMLTGCAQCTVEERWISTAAVWRTLTKRKHRQPGLLPPFQLSQKVAKSTHRHKTANTDGSLGHQHLLPLSCRTGHGDTAFVHLLRHRTLAWQQYPNSREGKSSPWGLLEGRAPTESPFLPLRNLVPDGGSWHTWRGRGAAVLHS